MFFQESSQDFHIEDETDRIEITEEQHSVMYKGVNSGKWYVWNGSSFDEKECKTYWLSDGSEHRTGYSMQTPPEGALLTKPEPPYDVARKEEYFSKWPEHEQLEALTEAADGRPEKLQALLSDIHKIKLQLPKPDDK